MRRVRKLIRTVLGDSKCVCRYFGSSGALSAMPSVWDLGEWVGWVRVGLVLCWGPRAPVGRGRYIHGGVSVCSACCRECVCFFEKTGDRGPVGTATGSTLGESERSPLVTYLGWMVCVGVCGSRLCVCRTDGVSLIWGVCNETGRTTKTNLDVRPTDGVEPPSV